jgi:transforming growth factor-beta-induced protein
MKLWKVLSLATAIAVHGTAGVKGADIVDTAVSAGQFKTLVAAVQAAELVETLKGSGPFTVLAPSDDAFAKLPEGTVAELVKPENRAKLTAILTFHVIPGKVLAKDALGAGGGVTVNGQKVDCELDGGQIMIENAKLVTADIECDNGVIHIIDQVIMPEGGSIPEVAAAAGTFKTLLAAATAGGLVETLSGDGPLTVFAPTDEAFADLPEGTVESLLKPENKSQLVDILTYHVVPGRIYAADALKAGRAATVQGGSVQIRAGSGGAKVNAASLLVTDIDASNGVIHVIDQVLLPAEKKASCRQMIHGAIAKGVPMYNSGHHGACADLYEDTLVSVMEMTSDPHLRSSMHAAITKARHQRFASRKAWTLRHCMDQMAVMLP